MDIRLGFRNLVFESYKFDFFFCIRWRIILYVFVMLFREFLWFDWMCLFVIFKFFKIWRVFCFFFDRLEVFWDGLILYGFNFVGNFWFFSYLFFWILVSVNLFWGIGLRILRIRNWLLFDIYDGIVYWFFRIYFFSFVIVFVLKGIILVIMKYNIIFNVYMLIYVLK